MKTVFNSSSDVIHLFAQQTQNNARCNNVFFEGKKIYSYGYHYLLGEFVTNKKGDTAVIINNEGYSQTTSKHISEITSGTSHYTQFTTSVTDEKKVLSKLEQLQIKLLNARKPELYISEANELFNKYKEYCDWNNIKINKQVNLAYSVFNTGEIKEYIAKKEKSILREKKKAEKEALTKYYNALEKFFNHEINRIHVLNPKNEDYLRLSLNGEDIETTQGVSVSKVNAKKLYNLIKSGRDIKGYVIDNYTVIGLNGILTIGCHKINVQNMHEVGSKL
ncbi:hypothetical protein [Elizabethkingia meningoseptica]|uniref:hypothetical protein n=1 Tax=Elizabethkingia meningoseptica TaxID=238 RepID=UPI00162697A4|nr:hypothetical protein [Elizabethkingia meningoseptica]